MFSCALLFAFLAVLVAFCAAEGCNMVELQCDRIKKASGCSLTRVLIDEGFLPIVKQVNTRVVPI